VFLGLHSPPFLVTGWIFNERFLYGVEGLFIRSCLHCFFFLVRILDTFPIMSWRTGLRFQHDGNDIADMIVQTQVYYFELAVFH
jgi:hypothetical protein